MIETRHSFANGRNGNLNTCTHLTPNRSPARPGIVVIVLAAAILFTSVQPVRGDVDAAAVQRAIDRGVAYLKKSQAASGGWQEYGYQSCGLSSLCVLALLTSGVSGDDPQIVNAMKYLRTFEPDETYSVALQTLVYCQLGSAGDLTRIRRNVQWLVDEQRVSGAGTRDGSWSYGGGRGAGDPSNTQFALLALGAAVERGVEVPDKTFEFALNYWQERQRPDGGWSYNNAGGTSTGSMTSAGIASLVISRSALGSDDNELAGDSIQCCDNGLNTTDQVANAIHWLAENFTLQTNPGGEHYTLLYYMYALERVGRLTGRRFIGQHDWYREGAEQLLAIQDEFQGFWVGTGPTEDNRDVATSFALLFLSKGKRQVVAGKLDYSSQPAAANWNSHPDGLTQLVRHIERDWGRDLTWQTVDAAQATVADLLQTPVLVISGREPLAFSQQLSQQLAGYLNQGGCILFDNDGCSDTASFRASVERLCRDWFPDAPLVPLPPDHPVWFAEHRVDPDSIAESNWIQGVQACCRTPVFYSPRSLSCRWTFGDRLFRRSDESPSIRSEIEQSIRLGENIVAYATGRELKDKLQQRSILSGITDEDASRGVLRMASVSLDVGGDQARRALANAAALLRERVPLRVSATSDSIELSDQSLRDVGLLWIHGRESFNFTNEQRQALRRYIERDGIVLANAICASDAFADSFRQEISQILPEHSLVAMPPEHPAWTKAFGGFDARRVTIRTPDASGQRQALRKQSSPPRLEAVSLHEITSVFFSPLDLSCALESQNSVQCQGYSTEDAVKIVANVLLFALNQ